MLTRIWVDMNKYFYILIILLSVWKNDALGQTVVIDSLKREVYKSSTAEQQLLSIFALCEQRHSLNPDTLYHYASWATRLAKSFKNQKYSSTAEYYTANYLLKKGNIDSALSICNDNINKLTSLHQSGDVLNDFQGCKAGILIKKNDYKEAMAQFYSILNDAELNKDTARQLTGMNGIGWVYMEMDQNRSALNWLFKAFHTSDSPKYLQYLLYIYSNIAANYNSLNKNDSAEYFITQAITLARKFQNLSALANGLNIQADILIDTRRVSEAEKSLTEALKIRKLVADPFYIVSDMMELAKFYAKTAQPQKGIEQCREGILIANKYNLSSKLIILYDELAAIYKASGDNALYSKTLEQIILLKDSLYEKNSARALADIQAKYDVQKTENIIIQQKLSLINRDYLLFGSMGLILLGLITVFLLFKQYRRKEKMQLTMFRQEEHDISFMAVIKAEENERKRIAADLHDNMGAYATAIIANVDEIAQRRSKLYEPVLLHLKNNASEIMSNLRDTIWALNKERIPLTGISDRFKNYIHKINPVYPDVIIQIEEQISRNIVLSAVQALNIFRILQEACTNALKHSNCSHIQVTLKSDEIITVSVVDNGSGIDENNYQKGNGLRNMQTRATESGFSFSISGSNVGSALIIKSISTTTTN